MSATPVALTGHVDTFAMKAPIAFSGTLADKPMTTNKSFLAEIILASGGRLSVKATGQLATYLGEAKLKQGQHLIGFGSLRETVNDNEEGNEETSIWVELDHAAVDHFPDWQERQ